MSNPFVGEIRLFAGNFAPQGWMFCDGQLLPISENTALFSLIGTTYGGDGQTTFALPDLRSRVPVHQGQGAGLSNRALGESAGVETVTLPLSQLASHAHVPQAQASVATTTSPSTDVWASSSHGQYSDQPPNSTMNPGTVQPRGGGQPHDNMLPFLTASFIISLFGVYPSP